MKDAEMKFSYYNQRRFSKPWGALITFEGAKAKYDFCGSFLGNENDGGKVYIPCKPGDIVAFGQKDNRGNQSKNDFYVVHGDYSIEQIDKSAAYEYWTQKEGIS